MAQHESPPSPNVASRQRRSRTGIFARKRDLLYLVYFLIHIPVMLGTCRYQILLLASDMQPVRVNYYLVPFANHRSE